MGTYRSKNALNGAIWRCERYQTGSGDTSAGCFPKTVDWESALTV